LIYYAMSDMHGFTAATQEALSYADLDDPRNKIVFCGDYINYGPDSCGLLYFLMELQRDKPDQVIVLPGNHETMLLDCLYGPDAAERLSYDRELLTARGFMTERALEEIRSKLSDMNRGGGAQNQRNMANTIGRMVRAAIGETHQTLFSWLRGLPYFYETEKQIFVHAGIDEEAGEFWKLGTQEDDFVQKFPAETGRFYKDVIAGHVGTGAIAGDASFHDVFWDGESHYYLDGTVAESGTIPLLKYDTETERYTEFKRSAGSGAPGRTECPIDPCGGSPI
jgi:serine/threonine protein phosphatase 1